MERNRIKNKIMRKLFLAIVVIAFAVNNCQAQIEHVSIGYGPLTFPVLPGETNPTQGGAAYLSIGGENGGGSLFIGGDSRITYGDEQYGSGMVALAGFRDFQIIRSAEKIKFGIFVGIAGFQTYQKTDLTQGQFQAPDPFPRPELEKTNIQPYGGVRLVVHFVEIQYAPVSNMITFGFKLL